MAVKSNCVIAAFSFVVPAVTALQMFPISLQDTENHGVEGKFAEFLLPHETARLFQTCKWHCGVSKEQVQQSHRDFIANRDTALSQLSKTVKKGDFAEVKRLLEVPGVHPNKFDFNKIPLLHTALYENHLDVARLLVEKGADVNRSFCLQNYGHEYWARVSPLFILTLDKYRADAISLILNEDHNVKTSQEHLELIRFFVKKGADINFRAQQSPNIPLRSDQKLRGQTPLVMATRNLKVDIVRLLLELGANKTIVDGDGKDVFERMREAPDHVRFGNFSQKSTEADNNKEQIRNLLST